MSTPGGGTSARWSRIAGIAGLFAGVCGLAGFPPGVPLPFAEGSPRHWLTHATGVPVELAAALFLIGLLIVRGRRMGPLARVAAAGGVLGLVGAAFGNALITWAAAVQGVREGGLYFLGHDLQSLALPLADLAVGLLAVTMLRSRVLPVGATWLLFASVPVAAATGPVLHAANLDGAEALNIVFATMSVMWAWWGVDLLSEARVPAIPDERAPDPASSGRHRRPVSAR